MATQVTASTPRTSPAPRHGALAAVIVTAIAVAVIGIGVWSQVGSIRDATTAASQAYGTGYPLHGGLAGPSGVGQMSRVAGLSAHYGSGYPLHGGLAGPSRSLPAVDPGAHYGSGYPLNGGLAGPSRVESGD